MKSTQTKLIRVSSKLSLLTLAVMASFSAMADDAGWYLGTNAGRSGATIDDVRIANGLVGLTSMTHDDRDTGYKLYGGYQFNKNFGLEGGFFDLGRFGFNATTVPTGTLSGNIQLRGLNLDLIGTLPITEKFSAFGRIGANYAQARDSFVGTGAVQVLNASPSQRDSNLKVGLGLQYALTESVAIRAEMERYRISDAVGNKGDIDLVSVGLVYRFGAKKVAPAPRVVTPEPVYVAPAQPVAAILAAPPPAVPPPILVRIPIRVTFSADSFFGFNDATIRPTGERDLDKFAADLKGTNFDVISVKGHSDRIGPHAYNLKLSTRRAEAVKAYLVQTGAIAASQIVAQGVDGSEPVTKVDECRGNKVTKALISCLQPDRRVEVEVSGMR